MQNSHNFGEQETEEKTLSEKILGLTADQRTALSINAPYMCNSAGELIPVSFAFGEVGKPALLEDAITWSATDTGKKPIIPPPIPEGVSGFWDPKQRTFRSRYLQPLAFGKTVYSPKEVTEALNLGDVFDVIHFLQTGKIFAFFDQFRLLMPPSKHDPLIYQVEYNGVIYNTVLVYRGCPFPYEYPFRPSIVRRFSSANTVSHSYEQLWLYVHNLVTEYSWILLKAWLKPIEVETIIQQFKFLPWTNMIDVTYDADIAMGFSLMSNDNLPDPIPCVYQMLIMQPDIYTMGAHSVWNKLDFARIAQQKALSFIGFSETMADPNGYVIALTEHVLASKRTGYGWHHLGIENIQERIQIIQDKLATQHNWLYPSETKEVQSFVNSVIDGIRRKYTSFVLDTDLRQEISQRLEELEAEVNS